MVQICHLPIRYLLSKVTTFADDTRGGKKRILALDGGGIRGVFTIEILGRMEQLLREHFGRPQMVLADHSDLIAGTSTGGIIGSFLSWGEPVDSVRKLYEENTGAMFCKAPWGSYAVACLMQKTYRYFCESFLWKPTVHYR
jgi:patatin-like phospholipase/acyl hydrolase